MGKCLSSCKGKTPAGLPYCNGQSSNIVTTATATTTTTTSTSAAGAATTSQRNRLESIDNFSISSYPSTFSACPAMITADESRDVLAANGHLDNHRSSSVSSSHFNTRTRHRSAEQNIDQLVLDTMQTIRLLVDNTEELPRSMLALHRIADMEQGWLAVIDSMITVIPLRDPLGPAVISLLIDECPLPTKDAISKLCSSLRLNEHCTSASSDRVNTRRHRNICVVLGCLAEKMAGPSSVSLLNHEVLKYLLHNLDPKLPPMVILFALIALEKFAQTSENKALISKALSRTNKLETLEKWFSNSCHNLKHEVGFCAMWCLDNLFISESRVPTHHRVDTSNINVMLNSHDVSEYLKISPNGLEARSDASSFESVRCTFQVDHGKWYYEVKIVTAGVMQIGWATKQSKFLNHEGCGIGDDEFSVSYDGCRQLIWYEAGLSKNKHRPWKSGDILGLFLDIDNQRVIFSLNGDSLPSHSKLFRCTRGGIFAAASFMSFQQCLFNFGNEKFVYPPVGVNFNTFNDCGHLSESDKVVLPRQERLGVMRQLQVSDSSCQVCFDAEASVTLLPCQHSGFCMVCAVKLESCPLCRQEIVERRGGGSGDAANWSSRAGGGDGSAGRAASRGGDDAGDDVDGRGARGARSVGRGGVNSDVDVRSSGGGIVLDEGEGVAANDELGEVYKHDLHRLPCGVEATTNSVDVRPASARGTRTTGGRVVARCDDDDDRSAPLNRHSGGRGGGGGGEEVESNQITTSPREKNAKRTRCGDDDDLSHLQAEQAEQHQQTQQLRSSTGAPDTSTSDCRRAGGGVAHVTTADSTARRASVDQTVAEVVGGNERRGEPSSTTTTTTVTLVTRSVDAHPDSPVAKRWSNYVETD